MKKILSITTLMLAVLISFGQILLPETSFSKEYNIKQQTYNNLHSSKMIAPFWSSDFSNPSDWVLDNTGSLSNEGWNIDATVDSWYFSGGQSGPYPIQSFSGGAFAELTNGDPFTQPTWPMNVVYTMTSALPIDVLAATGSSNATLNYQEYGARFNDLQEVQVSTDGINFTTVADNLSYPVLSTSGGGVYTNPTLKTINIQPYISMNPSSVWIRFRWTTNYPNSATNPNVWVAYGWMIDDVELAVTPANKITLIEENFGGWLLNSPITTGYLGLPYTFYPFSQATSHGYECEGTIINGGVYAQNNTKLNVEIFDGTAISVFASSSTPTTLNPLDTFVAAVSSNFIPTTYGVYDVNFWATSDSTYTDTVTRSTIVSDSIYGRDYDWNSDGSNAGNGSYKLGVSCGGQVLANAFEIYVPDTVTSISFFVDDKSVSNSFLKVELYEFDPSSGIQNSPPIWIGESDDYQLQSSDIDSWVTLKLNSPVSVFPGTGNTAYLAAVHGYAHPTDTTLLSTSGNDAVVTYVQDNGCELGGPGSAAGTWYGYGNTVMIRMNLGPMSSSSTNISEEAFNGYLSVYPNPTNDIFTIDLQNTSTDEYIFIITNVLGEKVYSSVSVVNGTFKKPVDLSYFGKGVYFITISNSISSITKKVVVE